MLDTRVVGDPFDVPKDLLIVLNGHKSITALAFSRLGLVSASRDYTAHLWDVASGVIIRRFNHPKGDHNLQLWFVEFGKLVLEDPEFDLGRELEGLVDMFFVQCINHNVENVLDLSDDMPKLVRGDFARVVQIFANLISNSIKFTTCRLKDMHNNWMQRCNFVNTKLAQIKYIIVQDGGCKFHKR
uniref:histidine kinase n=1 Tax=Vitis vinifera TaxID=29760 RepID=A5AUZ2_VITVI|nr:hypothetical protein VITISV_018240 [Vitis vinifera]